MMLTLKEGMPRFRSSRSPINSVKHVVDTEGALLIGGSDVPIAVAVDTPTTPFKPGDIVLGSNVSSFYLSIFFIGSTGAPVVGSVGWYIAKIRGGQTVADLPNPSNTGTSQLRNQIFHEEKGLVGSGDGTAMAFKGVIRVPRIY